MKFWSANEFLVDQCLVDYLGAALDLLCIFKDLRLAFLDQIDIADGWLVQNFDRKSVC